MKLYKTTWNEDEAGNRIAWDGSQADAAKRRKEARLVGNSVETEPVEFDTDKTGLLEWLNTYVVLDNG